MVFWLTSNPGIYFGSANHYN